MMKATSPSFLLLCSLLLGSFAHAEHQTFLRGMVSVPGLQAALLEMQHILVKPTNAPPVIITTSRLVTAREEFEDRPLREGTSNSRCGRSISRDRLSKRGKMSWPCSEWIN
jgi:hypothetical protein